MIEVFYRYRVHPVQAKAFEHAYGPGGPWSRLFARHRGFRRVRLFRHKTVPNVYVAVHVWESKADWEAFRRLFTGDCRRLDEQLAMLALEERLLGYFEGTGEYHAPIDTRA